jgi:hypothetical protein
MHDCALATLEDVVAHYDRHGGLRLSKGERRALVAFLGSLTDRDFIAAAREAAGEARTAPPAR